MIMGKVIVSILVRNWSDIELVALGKKKSAPREVKVEALIDSGATKLYLRASVVKELGLRQIGEGKSHTMSNRLEKRRIFSPVELEIQGRSGQFSVVEIPESLPNIVGQIPLEDLDWVIDMKNQKLIPNPEHKNGALFDDY